MDKQRLKLQLINRIVETEDENVLAELARALGLTGTAATGMGNVPFPTSGHKGTDTATQDLQNDIDEIFNP